LALATWVSRLALFGVAERDLGSKQVEETGGACVEWMWVILQGFNHVLVLVPSCGRKTVHVVGPDKDGRILTGGSNGRKPARGLAMSPRVALLASVRAAWHHEEVVSVVLCEFDREEAEKISN